MTQLMSLQIGALEAAHEKETVHRDVKPCPALPAYFFFF
jgi:hypothetical protein